MPESVSRLVCLGSDRNDPVPLRLKQPEAEELSYPAIRSGLFIGVPLPNILLLVLKAR
jgi:hypothetical protein